MNKRLSLTACAKSLNPPLHNQISLLVIGHWSLVIGHWSLVIGHWSLVIGHWSLVIGHWSLVIGHWSESFVKLCRKIT
ncbi:hypothetical protein [Coleofasciculus chthonoplastes]|uniref:hypothetical protein n=1 Tax=Coleofasciculus chthonoplastes TaxID=64178 RepID=UPI0032F343E3